MQSGPPHPSGQWMQDQASAQAERERLLEERLQRANAEISTHLQRIDFLLQWPPVGAEPFDWSRIYRTTLPPPFLTAFPRWQAMEPPWPKRPDLHPVGNARSLRSARRSRARYLDDIRALDVYVGRVKARYESGRREYEAMESDLQAYARDVASLAEVDRQFNKQAYELADANAQGDPEGVEVFLRLRASGLPWPLGGRLPFEWIEYEAGSKTVVLTAAVPGEDWLPDAKQFKRDRSGVISPVDFSPGERSRVLERLTACAVLRMAREMFALDRHGNVEHVAVNGIQNWFNPATGRDESRVVSRLELGRDDLTALDFNRLDPVACVRANGELRFDSPVRPRKLRPDRAITAPSDPPPVRPIRHNHDGEILAAEYMRWLGFADAQELPIGPDGGVDVRSEAAVAQVKMQATPVGRPELQKLYGVAQAEGQKLPVFFSQQGYGGQAREFADQVGMRLFTFSYNDGVAAENEAAHELVGRRDTGGSDDAPVRRFEWLEQQLYMPCTDTATGDAPPPDVHALRQSLDERRDAELEWSSSTRAALVKAVEVIDLRWGAQLGPTESIPGPQAASMTTGVGTEDERSSTSVGMPAGNTPRPTAQWAADPYGRHELRWFDGIRWTEHAADGGAVVVDPI